MKNLIRSAFVVMAALSNSACSENTFCNAVITSERPPHVATMSSSSSRGRDGCIPRETKRKPATGLKEQPICPRDGVPIQRKVVLVVQNHAESGLRIPTLSVTDAFTETLASNGFQVINPYNAIGRDLNRTPKGEVLPEESAVGIARRLKAHGVVTASIASLDESKIRTPTATEYVTYRVRVIFNLADAWSSATIASGSCTNDSRQYRLEMQKDAKQRQHLEELLFSAGEECARNLLKNNNVREWQPTQPPPITPPPPPPPPGTSLDHKVDALVREMLLNPQFLKNYEESKAKLDGRLPIAVIGGIENKSSNANLNDLIEAAGERFRVKLFNSKLFEVKDDGVLVSLARRIVASGNSPLENGEIMGALKQHGSPDFFVAGDLKRLTDLDGIGYYKLRLAIHSLSTGKTVWEGIETFNRKNEVSK